MPVAFRDHQTRNTSRYQRHLLHETSTQIAESSHKSQVQTSRVTVPARKSEHSKHHHQVQRPTTKSAHPSKISCACNETSRLETTKTRRFSCASHEKVTIKFDKCPQRHYESGIANTHSNTHDRLAKLLHLPRETSMQRP